MTNGNQKTLNTQDVLSMKGAGYYSKRTAGAKDAIDSMQGILERSILLGPGTFTLLLFTVSFGISPPNCI